MSFSTAAQLQHWLTQTRLISQEALSAHLKAFPGCGATIDGLIKSLEQRSLLTAYQASKLTKRDTDGLVVAKYKLLYRNASGSFARVFRGSTLDSNQIVGIKILRQRLAKDQRAVSLFHREGELGKRLKHKNIVPIYEVGSDGEQHYFTMEFVEGGNFRELLRIRQKFSPEEATKYIQDMTEGLEYALGLGFTHRDLKLTNVLLSAQGTAKLVDFGLAGADLGSTGIAEEADRAIEYGSLERNTGAPDGDPRSDLFFLGAIYYELLTGVAPYQPTKDAEERKKFSRYRNIRPIRTINPNIPQAVCEIVEQLLHTNPNDRYQTPTAVLADLRACMAKQHVSASRPPDSGEIASRKSGLLGDQATPPQPVMLCVESRVKQQDALRSYFTKHGYRVLMLGDSERALSRIASDSPPDGVVITSESIEPGILPVTYKRAVELCREAEIPLVLVLGKNSTNEKSRLPDTNCSVVLTQPVTLREIRRAIKEIAETLSAS
jgi:eukaryotic-like serine/threonine-protein kinase